MSAFFAAQSYTGSAVDTDSGSVVGMYILHPNHVGVIPGGFRNIDGVYEDIIPHYIVL